MIIVFNEISKYLSNFSIFLFFFLIFFNKKNLPQNTDQPENNYSIEFVESISITDDIITKNIFEKLGDLLLGSSSISLINPTNVLINENNNIFILDQGLRSILSISKSDNLFSEYKSDPFPSLVGLCLKNNDVLFTDSKLNKLYEFNIYSNSHKTINDSLDLNKPTGVFYLKSKKEIWIVETGNHSIVVLDDSGKIKKRIGRRGDKESEFNFPTSIWIDQNEKIYIVDAMNFRIQIFNKDGSFNNMFGEQGDATGYFARPKGIATDSFGNIYIVDALFHNVQIFDKEGIYLSNFGTQGINDGEFWLPNGLYINKNNRIYVADSYNSRIQIFQLMNKQ